MNVTNLFKTPEGYIYSNRALMALFIPLLIEYLELSIRSSGPLKHWLMLANSVGIIDADYYNNSDNEGHIYFQIINLSPVPIQLKKGDIIGQGIIHKYITTEDDCANGERKGGFGSTNE